MAASPWTTFLILGAEITLLPVAHEDLIHAGPILPLPPLSLHPSTSAATSNLPPDPHQGSTLLEHLIAALMWPQEAFPDSPEASL